MVGLKQSNSIALICLTIKICPFFNHKAQTLDKRNMTKVSNRQNISPKTLPHNPSTLFTFDHNIFVM